MNIFGGSRLGFYITHGTFEVHFCIDAAVISAEAAAEETAAP